MFDDVHLLEAPVPQQQPKGAMQVQCVLDTVFPYAIDTFERDIEIDGTSIITMRGNADYWPVFRVHADGSP